jgi:hypothetical protein
MSTIQVRDSCGCADTTFLRSGATFSVRGSDRTDSERIFPFDLIPRSFRQRRNSCGPSSFGSRTTAATGGWGRPSAPKNSSKVPGSPS